MRLIVLVLVLVLALLLVLAAWRSRSSQPTVVDRWAAARGLRLTGLNRPMVVHYLRTARQLRVLGAVAGLILPPPIAAVAGGDAAEVPGGLAWMVVGYLLGALCAEVTLGRPLAGGDRLASMVPRDLDDYLPRFLRLAQRAGGALAVVLGVAVAAVAYERTEATGMSHLPGHVALALAGLGLALALAIEGVQRWIVSRPQPVVASDLLEADDAIRSQSVHSVAGAGLALVLLILATLWWNLALSDVQALRWTAWVPAVGCYVATPICWLRLGHLPWRVRRNTQLILADQS